MRYLTTEDLWGHIFSGTRETATRFVYDTEERNLVALQLRDGATGGWTDGTRSEMDDVLDSLVNANSEAFDAPEEWGLAMTDDLPEWADPALPAPGI